MLDLNNKWNLVDEENEEIKSRGIVFKRPVDFEYCPLFCNSCKNVIATTDDVESMKKEKVCELCYITYYYVNKEKWNNGWRPKEKTTDEW